MKKIIVPNLIFSSCITFGGLSINTFPNYKVYAETKQEEILDISSSLSRLGGYAYQTQTEIDKTLKGPNLQLEELPELNTKQILIKKHMEEWSEEIYPKFIFLSSKANQFIRKFDSYYSKLQEFTENDEDESGFLTRLKKLERMVIDNKSKIKSYINELKGLKYMLDLKVKSFNGIAENGELILGENGLKNELQERIDKILKQIKKALENITETPDALSKEGFELFKEINTNFSELMNPFKDMVTGYNTKVKEILKRIVDAEKKAVEDARNQNPGISNEEIETIKKKAREEIEQTKSQELHDFLADKIKESQIEKKIASEKIKELADKIKNIGTITSQQQTDLRSLNHLNQELYDLTKDLKASEYLRISILNVKNNINTFVDGINIQIMLLENYQKDWHHINKSIDELSKYKTNRNLIRFKQLCNQLKSQNELFTNKTDHYKKWKKD
ncbi:HBL/NHE enterotoxin family protein [Bacillus sp. AR18-7]|uniref:HBL/NHE enterotoxin family protein n=1 Tax=Bacillus sp. AR18-7 TaxID=2217821 RepID=UPI0015D1E6B3|nr:HBL/NHE enterotoxin family protein [Bacillus sp. AR18-7]